jgi:hypothetical protein
MKSNCWEMKKCGREKGGANVAELGECPAASDVSADGINGGKNGGRICWALSGTFCGGKKQGTFAQKQLSCMSCPVYKTVAEEEGGSFKLLMPGQDYIALEQ